MKVHCESFITDAGAGLFVEQVNLPQGAPHQGLIHFHDAHELVIFEQFDGQFFNQSGQEKVGSGDVVFVPSMETHDFDVFEQVKRKWVLVQFEPNLVARLGLEQELVNLNHIGHFHLQQANYSKIQQIAEWLAQAYTEQPQSRQTETLLQLLIVSLSDICRELKANLDEGEARHTAAQNVTVLKQTPKVNRLGPMLEILNQNSAITLSLNDAAQKCHLSPAYFSRQFKQVFRLSYSEYVLRHKLNIAARLLSQTDISVTDMSYDLMFSNPSHFISKFRQQFNKTPKVYRSTYRDS